LFTAFSSPRAVPPQRVPEGHDPVSTLSGAVGHTGDSARSHPLAGFIYGSSSPVTPCKGSERFLRPVRLAFHTPFGRSRAPTAPDDLGALDGRVGARLRAHSALGQVSRTYPALLVGPPAPAGFGRCFKAGPRLDNVRPPSLRPSRSIGPPARKMGLLVFPCCQAVVTSSPNPSSSRKAMRTTPKTRPPTTLAAGNAVFFPANRGFLFFFCGIKDEPLSTEFVPVFSSLSPSSPIDRDPVSAGRLKLRHRGFRGGGRERSSAKTSRSPPTHPNRITAVDGPPKSRVAANRFAVERE